MADPSTVRVVRRHGLLALLIAGTCVVLMGAFVLLWFKLPVWAPKWVVEHSPFLDPLVRAVVAEEGQWEPASKRISGWGNSVVPALIDRLGNDSSTVRHLVALALAGIQDDRSIVPLVTRMRADTSNTENFMVVQDIQQALLKQNPALVAAAMLPLPTTNDMTAMVFIDSAGRVRDDRLVSALRRILWEAETAPPVTLTAKADDLFRMFGGRGGVAAASLARSPCPSALPVLLPAFADSDPVIRRRAVHGVMNLYQRSVVPLLADAVRQAITDQDQQVRRTAAMTAAIVNIPGAEENLLALSRHDDQADRTAAIRGLGAKWASMRAIERLTECLADPDVKVQLAVVRALMHTSNAAAVTPLLSALSSTDAKVRKNACGALFWKQVREDPRVVPALLPLMEDPDDAVSNEAERTLNRGSMTDDQRKQMEEAASRRKQRKSAVGAAGSAP